MMFPTPVFLCHMMDSNLKLGGKTEISPVELERWTAGRKSGDAPPLLCRHSQQNQKSGGVMYTLQVMSWQ